MNHCLKNITTVHYIENEEGTWINYSRDISEVISLNTIARNIKRYRVSAKMTQEQLAEKMNLTRQAISNWENEKACPDIESIMKLADALEIDVMLLLYGSAYETQYIRITPEHRRHNKILIILLVTEIILFSTLLTIVTWFRNRLYSQLCSYLRPAMIFMFYGAFAFTLGLLIGNIININCPKLSAAGNKGLFAKLAGVLMFMPDILLTLQALLILVWHGAPQPIYFLFKDILVREGLRAVVLLILPALSGVFAALFSAKRMYRNNAPV